MQKKKKKKEGGREREAKRKGRRKTLVGEGKTGVVEPIPRPHPCRRSVVVQVTSLPQPRMTQGGILSIEPAISLRYLPAAVLRLSLILGRSKLKLSFSYYCVTTVI